VESVVPSEDTPQTHASDSLSPTKSPVMESVGPPSILRYRGESRNALLATVLPPTAESEEDKVVDEADRQNFADFLKTMNVDVAGGSVCEFCTKMVIAWPTIRTQQGEKPHQVRIVSSGGHAIWDSVALSRPS
jgi:hypothetical protein